MIADAEQKGLITPGKVINLCMHLEIAIRCGVLSIDFCLFTFCLLSSDVVHLAKDSERCIQTSGYLQILYA